MGGPVFWIWFLLVLISTSFLILVSWRLRKAQVRIGRMESRLAAILAGPDSGFSVWDTKGHLVGFNGRFKQFYPDAPLKPGVVFEDLMRYTTNRGLVRFPHDSNDDEIEGWVSERVQYFEKPSHDVFRTSDGRWLDMFSQPTDAGEVLLIYSDTTEIRDAGATMAGLNHQLVRQGTDLQLLIDVLRAGQEEIPESAAAKMVEHVCKWSGWPGGFVYWVVAGESEVVGFELVASWAKDNNRFAKLRAMITSEKRQDRYGVIGRAHRTGQVVWVPNILVDPAIDPDRRVVMTGIRGVCAVPVTRSGQVVAVIEFLSSDQLTPDPMITAVLESMAKLLSSVLTSRSVA